MDSGNKSASELRRQAIGECLTNFRLQANPFSEELMPLDVVPQTPSKKLAVLLMTYKQEASSKALAQISSQSASLVRELRNDGFIFQASGKNRFLYTNSKGESCRKIIGFKPRKFEIKSRAKALLEKSIAACISAIEIYNKPDFKYREETFSILLVNAWELLLKARIIAVAGNDLKAIQVIKNGVVQLNKANNPKTIDIYEALNRLVNQGAIDSRCNDSIESLIEIRNNAVHFFNKRPDFSKKVQEFGIANLSNYVTAISDWFGKDLSEYNFYLMPISFFHPTEIESFSIKPRDKQMENMMSYLCQMENRHPFNENSRYNITAEIKVQFIRSLSNPSAIGVRFTSDEKAPKVTITEEDKIRTRYPLTYRMLTEKLKNKYKDFKRNDKFLKIMKDLEDRKINGEKYCHVRTTDVLNEGKGSKKKYYSNEIFKEFEKHYGE